MITQALNIPVDAVVDTNKQEKWETGANIVPRNKAPTYLQEDQYHSNSTSMDVVKRLFLLGNKPTRY